MEVSPTVFLISHKIHCDIFLINYFYFILFYFLFYFIILFYSILFLVIFFLSIIFLLVYFNYFRFFTRGHSWSFVVIRGHSCGLLDQISVTSTKLITSMFSRFYLLKVYHL